jgi:nucleoside phosphorylase
LFTFYHACKQDDKLMLENNASVKDMEAAAIAYVAELAGVPFFGVKVVTDIVDGDRPTQVLYVCYFLFGLVRL